MKRSKLLPLMLVLTATLPSCVLHTAPALASPLQVSIMADDDLLVNGSNALRDRSLK